MQPLPLKIKVLFQDVVIEPVVHTSVDDNGNLGTYCASESAIRLAVRGNANVGEVLLHEIMHACFYLADMSHLRKKCTEEQIVNRMSTALATVMRDNGDVFRWITHALEGATDGGDKDTPHGAHNDQGGSSVAGGELPDGPEPGQPGPTTWSV